MCTCSENINIICTTFWKSQISDSLARFTDLFHSEYKLINTDNVGILCLYCSAKKSKNNANCVKRADTSIGLIVFSGGLYHSRVYSNVTVLLHKSATIKVALGPWLNNTEKLFDPFFSTPNRTIAK
jgi:hypothetical protein